MAKLIHSMIRVLDLERSISFCRRAVDLEIADRAEFDSVTLVYLRNDESDFELELLGRYFFLSDPDGYRVEVLERAGRFV